MNNFTRCDAGTCKCLSGSVEANKKCWEKKVVDSKCTNAQECTSTIEGSVDCTGITNGVGKCECADGFSSSNEGTACSGVLSALKIYFSEFHVIFLVISLISLR